MSGAEICETYYEEVLSKQKPQTANGYKDILLAYAIVLYAFTAIGLISFLLLKSRYIYSRHKSTFAALSLSVGMFMTITVNVLRDYIGRESFPCITTALLYHIPMLWIASQPIGMLYLYIHKLRKERMKTNEIKNIFNEDAENQSETSHELNLNGIFQKRKKTGTSFISFMFDFFLVLRHSKNGRIVTSDDDSNMSKDALGDSQKKTALGTSPLSSAHISRSQSHNHQSSYHHRHTTTDISGANGNNIDYDGNNKYKSCLRRHRNILIEEVGVPIMMMLLFGALYPVGIALRILLVPIYRENCLGCSLTYADHILKLTSSSLYGPMIMFAVYAMRNEPDPLRILREFKIALVWGGALLTVFILQIVYSFNGVDDQIVLNCIETLGVAGIYYAFVLSGIVTGIIEERRSGVGRRKKRRDKKRKTGSITAYTVPPLAHDYSLKNPPPPSAIDLNLVLLEPKARNAFLEHSINEISSENVVFVFKLRAWKAMWEKEKADKLTKIAIGLFREYISKESKAPINLPFRIYSKLEKELEPFMTTESQKIDEESPTRKASITSKPKKEIFDESEKECVKMLEHDGLPRFVRSDLFKTQIIGGGLLEKVLKQ